MSRWHRLLVWMGLRPASRPVQEETEIPPEVSMQVQVVEQARTIAKAFKLKMKEAEGKEICTSFGLPDDSIFKFVQLLAFYQPEGHLAVWLCATVSPEHARRSNRYLSDPEEYRRHSYDPCFHDALFERTFFESLGDVTRTNPYPNVPLVGEDEFEYLTRGNQYSLISNNHDVKLTWFVGIPEATPMDTELYRPEDHAAFLTAQKGVQARYRLWLAERLIPQVQTSADNIVQKLRDHLKDTSHLVLRNDNTLRGEVKGGDGYAEHFRLEEGELTLLCNSYPSDRRYCQLTAYLWDHEQFRKQYQRWMQECLRIALRAVTDDSSRWAVDSVTLGPLEHGHHYNKVRFILSKKGQV